MNERKKERRENRWRQWESRISLYGECQRMKEKQPEKEEGTKRGIVFQSVILFFPPFRNYFLCYTAFEGVFFSCLLIRDLTFLPLCPLSIHPPMSSSTSARFLVKTRDDSIFSLQVNCACNDRDQENTHSHPKVNKGKAGRSLLFGRPLSMIECANSERETPSCSPLIR